MTTTFELNDKGKKVVAVAQPSGSNGEFKTNCPKCNDENNHLYINPEKGTFFCQKCSWTGSLWNPTKEVVAIYKYTDEKGKLLYQTVKYGDKHFSQRRPDGKGGWIWNLNDVERVLYHLPEVIKANQVFIVEGEKDVETLGSLGLVATTNPMGAGKWRSEYNTYFQNKEVIIIPDNDLVGIEHANNIGSNLIRIAKLVKILSLPSITENDGYDVSDYLTNHTKEDLLKLVRVSQLWKETQPVSNGNGMGILELSDLIRLEIPEKKRILDPWLSEQSITLISGWRGVGKTFFGLGIAEAITAGHTFGVWKVEQTYPILYVDGEMVPYDLKERCRLLSHGEKKSPFYVYNDCLVSQSGGKNLNLLDPEIREKLKKECLRLGVKVLFLDNLASLVSGLDENAKKDWDPINQWLLGLRFAGISSVMFHHVGKTGNQRGTSAREDNIDNSLLLRPLSEEGEGLKFIVEFKKDRCQLKDKTLLNKVEVSLIDGGNTLFWKFDPIKIRNQTEVLRMISEGMAGTAIATELGIRQQSVSKIRIKAVQEGLLTEGNDLTKAGKNLFTWDTELEE